MPTKQEHTNTAEVIRYRKRAQVAEQRVSELEKLRDDMISQRMAYKRDYLTLQKTIDEQEAEINSLHQRLNDALAEVVQLKSIISDEREE
jgi:oligoribonuclease NrnB/cAMP/cGMP phosphodiesterase (DHH superfamily)